ncbi:unnamed protein product [Parnassius mnemosyne]|uniref:SCP domain-containing protein n=1 Tax=Parnassius mnemosyne TaxID=213953 RepID=A0AAV1LJV5_9NEOP
MEFVSNILYLFQDRQIILTSLLYIFDSTLCSRVIDGLSQKSVYVAEYCPKMQYCKEGTHVMCMYYDKNREMGPHCLNFQNITITPVLATKLLEISNAIRSKVALGREKGKGGAPLPRAYGMIRLQWDEELATFAQVLANQCVLKHDMCRATKTFPDPGQTASIVRYTFPDWKTNSLPKDEGNGPGLNQAKLVYAITKSAKTWYMQKAVVTPEMITKYPDWLQNPTNKAGKLYLEMITAHATHMGCGMSAYSEYTYTTNNAAMHYNAICNFSARPRSGGLVYNTEAPSITSPGSQCGCPAGYDEDEDCLCNENPNYTPAPKQKLRSCSGRNCAPPIVLLPIVAMEDAPPTKLIAKRFNNETLDQSDILEIFNNDKTEINSAVKEAYSRNDFEEMLREARNNLQQARSQTNNEHSWNMQNVYVPKKPLIPGIGHQAQSIHRGLDHVRPSANQISRKSLFSKVQKFELPIKTQIKKDVLPRKDFSKVQNLVKTYMNTKRNSDNILLHNDLKINNRVNNIQSLNLNDMKARLNTAGTEKLIPRNYQIFKNKLHDDIVVDNNSISNLYGKTSNEDTDKKLMYLLNNLEQEVNHINLNQTEKEILDDKLRKIYGRISNKPKDFISSRKLNDANQVEKSDFLRFENTVHEHLLNERRNNDKNRIGDNFKEDISNRRLTTDNNNLDVHERLLLKERNSNEDFGSLKTRLEKPINENDHNINADLKYINRILSRNRNALVEYDDRYRKKLRALVNNDNFDQNLNRRDSRVPDLRDEKYAYKNYNEIRHKNYYPNHLDSEGQIGHDRRKYYQEKINYLERKLQKARSHRRHNKPDGDRQLRPVQPDRPMQPKTQKNVFYLPERARSVHGF